GFVDASGGGGWGPVATTTLLSSGRLEPRKVVGSVSASEFAVTVAACIAFIIALKHEGMDWLVVLGLLIGGVIAAPIGSWLAHHMPPRVLSTAAGGMIILANAWMLLSNLGLPRPAIVVCHAGLADFIVVARITSIRWRREEKRIKDRAEKDRPVPGADCELRRGRATEFFCLCCDGGRQPFVGSVPPTSHLDGRSR